MEGIRGETRGPLGMQLWTTWVQESSHGGLNRGGGKGDRKNNRDSCQWLGLAGGVDMGDERQERIVR